MYSETPEDGQEAEESKNIIDLNDDVLYETMKYFDVIELNNMAKVHPRFEHIVRYYFLNEYDLNQLSII